MLEFQSSDFAYVCKMGINRKESKRLRATGESDSHNHRNSGGLCRRLVKIPKREQGWVKLACVPVQKSQYKLLTRPCSPETVGFLLCIASG